MARKKVGAMRYNGTVEGGKKYTNVAVQIGETVRGKLVTFSHAGEIDCLAAIAHGWEENGSVP